MGDRLPTDLWVRAHLRRCFADGVAAYVIRRGDRHGGTVLRRRTLGMLHYLSYGYFTSKQTHERNFFPEGITNKWKKYVVLKGLSYISTIGHENENGD